MKNITEWKLVTKREGANIARAGKIAAVSVALLGSAALSTAIVGMVGRTTVITVGTKLFGRVGAHKIILCLEEFCLFGGNGINVMNATNRVKIKPGLHS
ncbi:MAG: hypothetical protein U9N83_09465 [Thermodesulfobacteriota bacterium]|nr:hypothetical protein [Thermodesulfobacteriota bacterium]